MANSLLLFLIMECATVSDAQVPANNSKFSSKLNLILNNQYKIIATRDV
jgi:hypothetical protein